MSFADFLLVVVGGYALLLVYILTRPRRMATVVLALVVFCSLVWGTTYYLELELPTIQGKLLVHAIRFPFLYWLPMLWWLLMRSLSGTTRVIPMWLGVALGASNVVLGLVGLTTTQHRLFQYDFAIAPVLAGKGLGILVFREGVLYRFCGIYYAILSLGVLIATIRAWWDASCILRRTLAPLFVAYLIPFALNLQYQVGASFVPHVNLAPFAMAVTVAILAWLVLGQRMLQIVPVARTLLLDHMRDLVFVTDQSGTLVDINRAGEQAIGVRANSVAGKPLLDLPAPWNALLQGAPGVRQVTHAHQTVWFDYTAPEIQNSRGARIGQLHLLHDMTDTVERQQRDQEFQALLAEKRQLRQQELLIRDLHDGIGGIVAGIGMLSARGLQETSPDKRGQILRRIMDLAVEGNIEVRSLMNTLENREFLWPDLIAELRRRATLVQENHDITCVLTVTGEGNAEGPGLFASMSLFRIVREALTNAVRHSGATRVSIDLTLTPTRMQLVLTDNGHGFSAQVPLGRGLRHIRQRIEELGGLCEIAHDAGVCLKLTAPLPLRSPDRITPKVLP